MQFYDRDGGPQCEDCYVVSKLFFDCQWPKLHITQHLKYERDGCVHKNTLELYFCFILRGCSVFLSSVCMKSEESRF